MKSKCTGCGVCCKLFIINLNKKESESGFYKTEGGNFLAQNEDGSCVYLKNNSCLIHHKRPLVCRRFFCTSKSKRFVKMIRLIEKKRLMTT